MTALTRREDLVRDQLAAPPRRGQRPEDAVRVGITGSGAELLVLTWSAADLAHERAAGTRLLARIGITPGSRVANTLAGALATPGSLLLGDVVEELGGLDVPLGAIATDADARGAWELVDRVEPGVLILDPGSAPRFLAAASRRARPWWRGIVWLRTDAPRTAAVIPREAGFEGWQRDWLAVPEVTSFAAGSCASGNLHLREDLAAEVVDTQSFAVLPAGQAGTLVLGPHRYVTGLAARRLRGTCACGEPGPALEALA
jgi:hypothetical protein